jgi:hypothetical protein
MKAPVFAHQLEVVFSATWGERDVVQRPARPRGENLQLQVSADGGDEPTIGRERP